MSARPGVRIVLRDEARVADRAAAADVPPSGALAPDAPPADAPGGRTPAEIEVEDREDARAILRHGRVRTRGPAGRGGARAGGG
ncbi:MAG: hypothetical protein ACTMIC_06065, partial [Cellulosimicrobium funkei]